MDQNRFFGVTVGRVANRIAKGKFVLHGKEYQLAKNNGENHLHGGPTGFHKVRSHRKYICKIIKVVEYCIARVQYVLCMQCVLICSLISKIVMVNCYLYVSNVAYVSMLSYFNCHLLQVSKKYSKDSFTCMATKAICFLLHLVSICLFI
jgi:hypothetical protein